MRQWPVIVMFLRDHILLCPLVFRPCDISENSRHTVPNPAYSRHWSKCSILLTTGKNYQFSIAMLGVSRFGPVVRRLDSKAEWHRFNSSFGSPLSSEVAVCGHCLVILFLTVNGTLKWLSSLPILKQESFWWWQCSERYSLPLPPPPGISVLASISSETARR